MEMISAFCFSNSARIRRLPWTFLEKTHAVSINIADTRKPIKIINPLFIVFLYQNHRNIIHLPMFLFVGRSKHVNRPVTR
jgi:hypothetical protein